MNIRRASSLMRRVWPLVWPVSVRSRVLPFPVSGQTRTVSRMIRGPRGGRGRCGPTHLILLDPEHADAETLVHEWAHAAYHEVEDDFSDADVGSLDYELHGHGDNYWLTYGQIYRALTRYTWSLSTEKT